jgi:transposase-like protein
MEIIMKINIPICTHCGSTIFTKNGSYKGSQRFKCKSCNRAFSDKVRKFTYADKEKFMTFYLNNTGIRKSALFMNCSPALLIKWVKELSENLRQQLRNANLKLDENLPDIIELDEIYTRVKKGEIACSYGLLILDGEIKLLHIPSALESKPR